MYQLEKHLIEDFIAVLPTSSFSNNVKNCYSTEFNYIRGRTDIVLLNEEKEVIAIEAKLNRWKEALHQAYRNTCFAHYSYILIPEDVAYKAEQYNGEFNKRSVGICYLSNREIVVSFAAKKNNPIQAYLTQKAVDEILEFRKYDRKY